MEILLHQAQLFTRLMVVTRIEHFTQFAGSDTGFHRVQVMAVVEFLQIERGRVAGVPQTQSLHHLVVITDDR